MKDRRPTPVPGAGHFPLLPKLIATSFGFGYLPVAPGTWGAIFAVIIWLPLYIFAAPAAIFWITLAAAVLFAVLGTWASSVSERYWGKDPVIACVDETVGQLIAMLPLCCVPGQYWWEILLSLALFRFFDIFKPLGIRKLEVLPRGYGMMADDILAAIYSCIILLALNHFII